MGPVRIVLSLLRSGFLRLKLIEKIVAGCKSSPGQGVREDRQNLRKVKHKTRRDMIRFQRAGTLLSCSQLIHTHVLDLCRGI